MNHSRLRQKWIKNDAKVNYLRAETEAFSLATRVIRDWLWGHERCSQIFHPLIGKCEFILGTDLPEFQFPHQQMETARRPASHRVCVADAATVSSWEHCLELRRRRVEPVPGASRKLPDWFPSPQLFCDTGVSHLRWHTRKTEQYSQPVKYSIKWDLANNFYSYGLPTCFLVSFSKMS